MNPATLTADWLLSIFKQHRDSGTKIDLENGEPLITFSIWEQNTQTQQSSFCKLCVNNPQCFPRSCYRWRICLVQQLKFLRTFFFNCCAYPQDIWVNLLLNLITWKSLTLSGRNIMKVWHRFRPEPWGIYCLSLVMKIDPSSVVIYLTDKHDPDAKKQRSQILFVRGITNAYDLWETHFVHLWLIVAYYQQLSSPNDILIFDIHRQHKFSAAMWRLWWVLEHSLQLVRGASRCHPLGSLWSSSWSVWGLM